VRDSDVVTTVAMFKYHGLGNDFLVSLDPSTLPGGDELDADFARRLCDRHRGFGADGFIVARAPRAGGDVAMELRNADGGRAEVSGNGLRCLALALFDGDLLADRSVTVETDAGSRRCVVGDRGPGGCAGVRVEMGDVTIDAEVSPPSGLGDGWRAFRADTGNPHLVLVGETLDGLDLAVLGPTLEHERPGGQNVEAVTPGGDGLDLVVWERGAGLTEACGSGSVAAAAVARTIGLVGDRVPVRNPGGSLLVTLSTHSRPIQAELEGPACRIGRVELEIDKAAPA
jgi:diaminopimelate epimerase